MSGGLRPAHEGYRHQDLLAAIAASRVLKGEFVSIAIDKKTIADDPLDDLALFTPDGDERRVQVKSSKNTEKALELGHFKNASSDISLVRLLHAHRSYGPDGPSEYRLCVTWREPVDDLVDLLESSDAPPLVPGTGTKRYRMSAMAVWPDSADPKIPVGSCTRKELEEFCERLVIEVQMPPVGSLWDMGPLEHALVDLVDKDLGVSSYPNKKDPVNFAALAIALANWARANDPVLTPPIIEARLQLRVNYGRVEQQFPIDERFFRDRKVVEEWLEPVTAPGGRHIVTGMPGAGKSWLLTKTAERLAQDGAIVARHYCYLDPGDEAVEERVKHETLFGNLIAETLDADPTLRSSLKSRYAASSKQLSELLAAATLTGRRVVLLIDGLDHIARVRSSSRLLSEEETGIVERFLGVEVPAEVTVIIGSQPGEHLSPLVESEYHEVAVPSWNADEVRGLQEVLGVVAALERLGSQNVDGVAQQLSELADGNPLCGTLLARDLVHASEHESFDADDWLARVPLLEGQVAAYYTHLCSGVINQHHAIADLLAMLDFSVTRDELKVLAGPLLAAHVDAAVARLRPVLRDTVAGGVRIFHESFRRFIVDRLAQHEGGLGGVLGVIIDYLSKRGFRADLRAYQHLIPLLLRAGRESEVLDLLDPEFVSVGLAEAQPLRAIERNLLLGARTSAKALAWEKLVTAVELLRQLDETRRALAEESVHYWRTLIVYRGADFVKDRLLYEGCPTLDKWDGLLVCQQLDAAGAVAPWAEYLELAEPGHNEPGHNEGMSSAQDHDLHTRVGLARLAGRMRVEGTEKTLGRVRTFLRESGANVTGDYVDALVAVVASVAGPDAIVELLSRSPAGPRGASWCFHQLKQWQHTPLGVCKRLPPHVRRVALGAGRTGRGRTPAGLQPTTRGFVGLGYGRLHETRHPPRLKQSVFPFAVEYRLRLWLAENSGNPLTIGMKSGDWNRLPTGLIVRSIVQGLIPPARLLRTRDPSVIELGFSDRKTAELGPVREWVERVRLAALRSPGLLTREMTRLEGAGWYRGWLRFVIGVARAERLPSTQQGPAVVAAFGQLNTSSPFEGSPRAVDLHAIIDVIFKSIGLALRRLSTASEWEQVLGLFGKAVESTSASLWRAPWGPLPLEKQLELLEEFADDPTAGSSVRLFLANSVHAAEEEGTYYGYHARHAMYSCRVLSETEVEAASSWRRATQFLAAYGHHKDITIFELLESAPVLAGSGRAEALEAIASTQTMTEALLDHTDGRATGNAINVWFRAVADIDVTLGIQLLAQARHGTRDAFGRYLEEAFEMCLSRVADLASPSVRAWCWALVPFEPDYDGDGERLARAKIEAATEFCNIDADAGAVVLRLVASQIANDARGHFSTAVKWLSTQQAVPFDLEVSETDPEDSKALPNGEPPQLEERLSRQFPGPLLPNAHDYRAALVGVRHWTERTYHDAPQFQSGQLVIGLGFRLLQLAEEGKSGLAVRLLKELARCRWFSEEEPPLVGIAEGLALHGATELAAVAYALAYARARGQGGWSPMGDAHHEHLLNHAVELDKEVALQIFAQEIVEVASEWPGSMGITRAMVERLASLGDHDAARRVWWAAFEVVEKRIPLRPDAPTVFPRLADEVTLNWSVNEALCALVLTELHDPRIQRKLQGLLALHCLIDVEPSALEGPACWFLTSNCLTSSMVLTLKAYAVHEGRATIASRLLNVFMDNAVGGSWFGRMLTRRLVEGHGTVGATPTYDRLPVSTANVAKFARQRFEYFADGGIRQALSSVPGASEWALERFAVHFSDNVGFADRCKSRFEMAYGTRGANRPITPILAWETEFTLGLADEVLNHLSPHLWHSGRWSPDAEERVLDRIVADIRIHLASVAARRPRPRRPLPTAEGWRTMSVPEIAAGREFEGWRVFGYHEMYWPPNPKSFGAPTTRHIAFAGAALRMIGEVIPVDTFPFGMDTTLGSIPAAGFVGMGSGPLCVYSRLSTWLGELNLVMLPEGLADFFGLRLLADEQGLRWIDDHGEVQAIFRTWLVRDRIQFDAAPARARGSELLVSPDLFSQFERVFVGELIAIDLVALDTEG